MSEEPARAGVRTTRDASRMDGNSYPIGGQKVRMSLPQGRQVTRVELMRAETNIPFTEGAGTIEFTIPGVLDHEVAALYSA